MEQYYYIYNLVQAKYIIKYTQDFDFFVGVGSKGDVYFKFNNTEKLKKALDNWKKYLR